MLFRRLRFFLEQASSRGQQVFLRTQKGNITYGEFLNKIEQARKQVAANASHRVVGIYGQASVDYLALCYALWQEKRVSCLLPTRLDPVAAQRLFEERVGGLLIENPVLKEAAYSVFQCRPLGKNQIVAIIFTSGSSGRPRAVSLSYGNFYYSATGAAQNMPINHEDCWLLSLPLYHVGGFSIPFRMALVGGSVALAEGLNLGEAIAYYKPTIISLVATQLKRLLEIPGVIVHLQKMRYILVGGGPIPAALIAQARQLNLPLRTTYGLSEMTSQVTTSDEDDRFLETAGRVLPYRRLKIKNGQVYTRGRVLFAGYYPQKRRGRWHSTKDLGFLDKKGRLVITGRADNMFISGGENIQPEEIEMQLLQLARVELAVVLPIASAEFGQRPIAFVKTTGSVGANDLKIALSSLEKFKIPDFFYLWPAEIESKGLKAARGDLQKWLRKKTEEHNSPVDGLSELLIK